MRIRENHMLRVDIMGNKSFGKELRQFFLKDSDGYSAKEK
jgi:hypothetical protein